MDRTTLAAELKRNKEFAVAMSMAMAQGHMSVVEVLHKCMAGKGNSVQLRAACFMLMRKWWQDWGERKPEPEVPQEPEISQERLVAELIEEAEAQMQYEADARKQINNGEDNGDAGGT